MHTLTLHRIHRNGQDYAAVLRWLADNGLTSHLRAHLDELPADHPYWNCVVGEFGESTLIGFGVDI